MSRSLLSLQSLWRGSRAAAKVTNPAAPKVSPAVTEVSPAFTEVLPAVTEVSPVGVYSMPRDGSGEIVWSWAGMDHKASNVSESAAEIDRKFNRLPETTAAMENKVKLSVTERYRSIGLVPKTPLPRVSKDRRIPCFRKKHVRAAVSRIFKYSRRISEVPEEELVMFRMPKSVMESDKMTGNALKSLAAIVWTNHNVSKSSAMMMKSDPYPDRCTATALSSLASTDARQ